MFHPHVPVILCVIAQIFVAAQIVVPIGDAKVSIESLLGSMDREANATFQRFGIFMPLPMHIQLFLAIKCNYTYVANKLALNLEIMNIIVKNKT